MDIIKALKVVAVAGAGIVSCLLFFGAIDSKLAAEILAVLGVFGGGAAINDHLTGNN